MRDGVAKMLYMLQLQTGIKVNSIELALSTNYNTTYSLCFIILVVVLVQGVCFFKVNLTFHGISIFRILSLQLAYYLANIVDVMIPQLLNFIDQFTCQD